MVMSSVVENACVLPRDQVALGELKDKRQNNKTDDTRLEVTAKNC